MRTILKVMSPEKQQKPVKARVSALSGESVRTVPFSPQGFCSPCVFDYCCHNTGSYGPGSASTIVKTNVFYFKETGIFIIQQIKTNKLACNLK